jgi:Ca2+-transporting ATPase
LPVVATLSLARGMLRMAARNAVITNLSAVETLGATTVILTDKTGTLTENRMTVVRYLLAGAQVEVLGQGGAVGFQSGAAALSADTDMRLAAALRVGALCNGAALGQADDAPASGDPMEVALLHVARAAGHGRTGQLQARAEIAEHAFDPGLKMMASVHRDGAGVFFAVKGAPEAVIAACTHVLGPEGPETLDPAGRADWVRRSHDAARDGLRLLALAMKQEARPDAPPYAGLTLVGLACLRDPLRADVRAAVAAARGAGVRVVMMTGDHAQTAAAIARQAGLADGAITVIEGHELHDLDPDGMPETRRQQLLAADVFARVTPETKLGLARLFQRSGHIVAMNGDGVNDAPALKQADIGIAMGLRGTDVAREAAQMVLKDDALGTIIAAMQQGRMIFDNIRKFVVYLMSCNVSEVLIVGLAVGAGLPMPLLPLQILFLNLVTDVFPAFALGLGQGEDGSMQQPPRAPSEPIVGRHGWVRIGVLGGAITVATLAAFGGALNWLHLPVGPAITVAFVTLALAQLWNVFNMRAAGSAMLRNDITCNPWIWAAIGFCLLLTGMALWLPLLSGVLKLPDPGWQGLALAAGASLFPLLVGQLFAVLDARRAPRRNRLAARGPRDTMARHPDRRR